MIPLYVDSMDVPDGTNSTCEMIGPFGGVFVES